jgi:putative addiction module component (TIGR02574 family)
VARKNPRRFKSPAFKAIHSSASALLKVGAISKATMREFDESCLATPPTPEFASMDDSTEKLTTAALRLPPADRAKIAEALLLSLEAEEITWEAAWLAEAARRGRAADGNPSRVSPASEMFAAVRERLPAEHDKAR